MARVQLGDIIRIEQSQEPLAGQWLIDYIDPTQIDLIETRTSEKLHIDLANHTITAIDILSRADSPGFVEQNGLEIGAVSYTHLTLPTKLL
jgi:hypothetical protein